MLKSSGKIQAKTPQEVKTTQRAQIPLTNLDQHDGTTGPSLKPDWSFSASPATFTIFFFLLREKFWVEGRLDGGEPQSPLEIGD